MEFASLETSVKRDSRVIPREIYLVLKVQEVCVLDQQLNDPLHP